MSTARTVVSLISVSAAVSTLGAAVETGHVEPRILAGGAVAAVFLVALSDVAPKVALGLAVVVTMTSALTAGPTVLAKLDPTK